MRARPTIALLTDFGHSDAYVASMKGVLLSLLPTAHIVDITHSIASQNIDSAAYVLWSCYSYFPVGTIFVCVVDPGVGTERNILAVQGNGYTFLSPDNGLLKFVLGSISLPRIISVTRQKFYSKNVSRTFHGRDIFAPVSARLASGSLWRGLGPKIVPKTKAQYFQRVLTSKKREYAGNIIHIDHFGNIITDFMPKADLTSSVKLRIANRVIDKHSTDYASGSSTKPYVIIGSNGLLEIFLKNGSASKILRAKVGQTLRLSVQ